MGHKTRNYSLHITEYLESTAWALAVDVDGAVTKVIASSLIPGATDTTMRGQILAEVVGALQEDEHVVTGGWADLVVFDGGARRILLELGGEFGPITVLARSAMKYAEGWDRVGWARCLDLLGKPEFAETRNPGRVVEAATDGSYSRGRGGGASLGWVRDDGRFGFDTVKTGSIFIAELTGIESLLNAAETGERLRVYVDSKDALRAIENAAAEGRERLSNKAETILRTINDRRTRVDVEFVWVKSHQGHPLNDGADRLARLARQTQDVDTATRAQIAKNIVEESLITFHSGAAV